MSLWLVLRGFPGFPQTHVCGLVLGQLPGCFQEPAPVPALYLDDGGKHLRYWVQPSGGTEDAAVSWPSVRPDLTFHATHVGRAGLPSLGGSP